MYDLGASLECENEFEWKPLQIAQCWKRTDLAHFLQNPKKFEVEIFSPPPSSAQSQLKEQILKKRLHREKELEKQREAKIRQQKLQEYRDHELQQNPLGKILKNIF